MVNTIAVGYHTVMGMYLYVASHDFVGYLMTSFPKLLYGSVIDARALFSSLCLASASWGATGENCRTLNATVAGSPELVLSR